MDKAERERLRGLIAEATPGPWERWAEHDTVVAGPATANEPGRISGHRAIVCEADGDGDWSDEDDDCVVVDGGANAEFIAASRTALPQALDALDQAEAALRVQNDLALERLARAAAAEERARGLEEDYARLADAAGAWTYPGWVFLRDRPEGVNLPDELKAARAALAPDAEGEKTNG